jgi:ATP-dependent exoDNAse (exonuclease V) alpha subunit
MGIPPMDIQVLSPTRRYGTGSVALCRQLQEALNPASPGKKEKVFGTITFREGDRVMQIKNNYDIIWYKTATKGGNCPGKTGRRAPDLQRRYRPRGQTTRRKRTAMGGFRRP